MNITLGRDNKEFARLLLLLVKIDAVKFPYAKGAALWYITQAITGDSFMVNL